MIGERGALVFRQHLHATVRECWVLASNRRLSAQRSDWTTEPTLHAGVIESICVDESHRRQGLCRAFLASAIADTRYDLHIVEGVGNPVLASALDRWGWECDRLTMDFYWKRAAELTK